MMGDGIDEEARIGDERLEDDVAEIIRGSIRDLLSHSHGVVAVERNQSVSDAVSAMIKNRVGVVLILNEGKVDGLFSERDVVTRVVAQSLVPSQTTVADVMTPNPECLTLDADVVLALNRMTVGGYRHIPVVDSEGNAISLLSMRDVMHHIVSFFAQEVYNLHETQDGSITNHREGA